MASPSFPDLKTKPEVVKAEEYHALMEEESCNSFEEKSRLAGGGGKAILGSSSFTMPTLITSSFMDIMIPVSGDTTDPQEVQHADKNMTSEIETTSCSILKQQHHKAKKEERKRGREDDSDVESSSKRRRTISAIEEKRPLGNEEETAGRFRREQEEVGVQSITFLEEESHNKNEPTHVFDQVSSESNNTAKTAAKDELDAVEAPLPSSALHKDYDDSDVDEEKSTRHPLFDYETSLRRRLHTTWRLCEPLNFFTAADWLKCIANIHPVDERSELEKEIGMFCRDCVSHHPKDRNYLEYYDGGSCDRDVEKIYESLIYLELQNLVKTFDRQTVLWIKQCIALVPKTEEVYSYKINWAVVDEHNLHKKIRPWISNNVKITNEEDAEYIVDSLQRSMKDHVSASRMLQRISAYYNKVSKFEAECLFLKLWRMLIFRIKNVEEAAGSKHTPSVAPKEEWAELGQEINAQATNLLTRLDQDSSETGIGSNVNKEKICDSDNHHELLNLSETFDVEKPLEDNIFNYMIPNTIEELLSFEINWAVYDEHELHKAMKPWMTKEILELLKKEKAFVVDYIVKVIKEHESPFRMLELLQPFVEDDTETVVQLLWRTLVILVKILETGFHQRISIATPNREMLDGETEKHMSCNDKLSRQTSVWTYEESKRAGGVYDRNKRYNSAFWRLIKAYKFEVLCELVRVRDAIPTGIKELLNYNIDWAVSDKVDLHNTLRPWISREITVLLRSKENAATLVDSIVSIIKDHCSASELLKLVKPKLGIDRSKRLLQGLWRKLIFGIMSAGEASLEYDVPIPYPQVDEERIDTESGISDQFGDRYSRNRHYLLMAFDYENLCELRRVNETMPKTKKELFSCEINWDVFDKHQLHVNMRRGIWIETLELIRQKEEAVLVGDEIIWSIFDYHASASQREFIAQGKANMVVDQIMRSLSKDHVSASQMTVLLQPTWGHGSEKFVTKMWYALICGIKLLEARVKHRDLTGRCSVVLLR